ncbi:MAG: RNA-binding domain-containing protein [Anaerolineae bacterium]
MRQPGLTGILPRVTILLIMVELLTEEELGELISAPEGQTLERKSPRIHPRDLATTLIASANADGGRLLIGVEDDGTVSGLDLVAGREQVERMLHAAYEYCTPSGRITNREYRELFGISNTTAYADLTGLMEKGLIERAGVGRGVFYRLTTRNNQT